MPMIETRVSPEREAYILERVRTFWEVAQDGNAELFERMAKAKDYKVGKQYDAATLEANKKKRKFSLTIPLIRPQVNQILGQYIQNPSDITCLPRRGGLQMIADLETALIRHAMSDENAQYEQQQYAAEGLTTGLSGIGVFIERERDPKYGDLELRKVDCFDFWPDPTSTTYDPDTRRDGWKFEIWRQYADKDWMRQKWPDKAALIAADSFGMVGGFVNHVKSLASRLWGRTAYQTDGIISRLRSELIHTWWIEYRPVSYFYDMRDENAEPLVIVSDEEKRDAEIGVEQFPDTFRLEEVSQVVPVMNHTLTCGGTFLENRFDELNLLQSGQTLFPIIPFSPYFDSGYRSGIPEDLIGAQDFVNAMRSMVVNIIKNTANSGWLIKNDPGGLKKKWLEAHGSEDGVVIDVSQFGGEVQRIEPNQLPTAAAQLTEIGKNEFERITNVHGENPENPQRESGVSRSIKYQATSQGYACVFANLDYSLKKLGTLLATVIRSLPIYSLEEIRKIVDEKDLIEEQALEQMRYLVAQQMGIQYPFPPLALNTQIMAKMAPEDVQDLQRQIQAVENQEAMMLAKIDEIAKPMVVEHLVNAMRNPRGGRYGVEVSESTSSPTYRAAQFEQELKINEWLVKSGQPGLPGEVILDASDLPKSAKEKTKAAWERQAQGAGK